MERTNHVAKISRRLIAIMPVLLIFGIIAQAILLVAVIVLYVPCLVWPGILDGPYRLITKNMGRIMVRSIVARKSAPNKTRNGDGSVTISLYDPPGLGASGPGGFHVQWRYAQFTGGTMDRAQMVSGLIQREEAANESYLTSQMDNDTWTKELQEVDEKLGILGLRMVFRPWEGHATNPIPRGF